MVASRTIVAALLSIPTATAFIASPSPSVPSLSNYDVARSTALGAGPRTNTRRGPPQQKEFVPPMNDEIKQNELRVTVATKEGKDLPLGVMSKKEALAKAEELGGLDLILINPNSDPPVCKIVDYSKYRYMQEKKRKEKAKNSKATEVKEVKMSYKIGGHDYDVRLKAASKFIKQGNRVKLTVMFRGREVQHDKLGEDLLIKLANDLEDICNMEGRPRREGRNLGAILTPRAEVVKAVNDAKRLKEKEKKKAKAESLAKRMEMEELRKAGSLAGAAGVAAAGMDGDDESIRGVLDGIDIDFDDDDDDDDDEDYDFDDDEMDASLDELLGSDKVADDLFS